MATPVFTFEGEEELTRKLAALEAKALRKVLPKAAKAAADIVVKDYKSRVPVDSGTMRDSVGKKVNRYKHIELGERISRGGRIFRVKRTVAEDIGASVIIDRKRFYKVAAKRGKKLSKDEKRGGEGFFYPSIVELGGHEKTGERPLTKSLYENDDQLRQRFLTELRYLVANPTA